MSGKYDFNTLRNNVPCFIKMVPIPTKENKKEEEEVPVSLQYRAKWSIESNMFSGWCITALEDGDEPQVTSLFELETTGNFSQQYNLYCINIGYHETL